MNDLFMALARANLYGFLSAVFSSPPSAQLASELCDGSLLNVLRDLGWTPRDGLDASLADATLTRGDLAVAFTRLIVGPGHGYVPPYGSIYLDTTAAGTKPRLWGPSAVAIGQMYQAAGLQLAEGQVPDHLAIELAFMQHLCGREASALSQGDETTAEQSRHWQSTVLRHHLGSWLPSWLEEVMRATPHPFYEAMARLTAEFLGWDTQALNSAAPEVRANEE